MTPPDLTPSVLADPAQLSVWLFVSLICLGLFFLVGALIVIYALGKRAVDDFIKRVDERFNKGEKTMECLRADVDDQGDTLTKLVTEHVLRHGGEPIPGVHRRDHEPETHRHKRADEK